MSQAARTIVAVTILTAAAGCDRADHTAIAATVSNAAPAPAGAYDSSGLSLAEGDSTDLSQRPDILFQVFGERDDPRLRPVASLSGGKIRPLVLSADGWQRFDSLYHQPGMQYTIYQDGQDAGWARVKRPMWDGRGDALYSLPRCRSLTPLAAAQVKAPPPVGYLVEHIATNAPMAATSRRPRRRASTSDNTLSEARKVAESVAEEAGVDRQTMAALDFRASAVQTGANDAPTLVISIIDPAAGTSTNGNANHLFILADRVSGRYQTTYTRIVRSSSARTEYRRYVDHLDLTGDGVDELVLEGWSSGHESYLLVLQNEGGQWVEVFQGRPSWCLDR